MTEKARLRFGSVTVSKHEVNGNFPGLDMTEQFAGFLKREQPASQNISSCVIPGIRTRTFVPIPVRDSIESAPPPLFHADMPDTVPSPGFGKVEPAPAALPSTESRAQGGHRRVVPIESGYRTGKRPSGAPPVFLTVASTQLVR
jgi:hypothetical protein